MGNPIEKNVGRFTFFGCDVEYITQSNLKSIPK